MFRYELRNEKIVHSHLFRTAFRAQLQITVVENTDQFFLLVINRSRWLVQRLTGLDFCVDVLKLCFAVQMISTFQSLLKGLKAIAKLLTQFGHQGMIAMVLHPLEFLGELANTLVKPAQWRLGVVACDWFRHTLETLLRAEFLRHGVLPAIAFSANTSFFLWNRSCFELLTTQSDGSTRDRGLTGHNRHTPIFFRVSFGRRMKHPKPLIKERCQRGITLSYQSGIHARTAAQNVLSWYRYLILMRMAKREIQQ